MWLTNHLVANQGVHTADTAEVTGHDRGAVRALNDREYRKLPLLCPAGICSLPTQGEQAVVLPLAGGATCAGVIRPAPEGLQPGELRLCSSGGAEILLKNDGTILLNGRVIPAANKEEA